jgi:hypothetical protein
MVPGGPPGGAGTRAGAPYVWEHAGQERKCYRMFLCRAISILFSIWEIAGSNQCQGTYPKVAVTSLNPCTKVLMLIP